MRVSACQLLLRAIAHLDQPLSEQILQQGVYIMPAPLGFDIVGLYYGVPDFRYSLRLLEKAPDVRADRIEAIIHAIIDI
jgi:hypothetical protein